MADGVDATLVPRMLESLPAEIQGDHRTALGSRLRYGNQVSLHKRLKQLCERLPPSVVRAVLGGARTPSRRWVATRNYYTHWDEASRDGILDDAGLVEACVRLRALVAVLYLDYAGVPEHMLLDALTGASPLAQHLLQLDAMRSTRGSTVSGSPG